MYRKIILGAFFLFTLQNAAQTGSASFYSSYGLGETKFANSVENRSMAGMGVVMDSIHINFQNPAGLSVMKLTSLAMGGAFSKVAFRNTSVEEKAQRVTFDYLTAAFPLTNKLGVGVGLYANSYVGYKINSKVDLNTRNLEGFGGMNRAYVALGYKITPKFSLGAEFDYDFGIIQKNIIYAYDTDVNATFERSKYEVRGGNIKLGGFYKTKISQYDFVTSGTVDLPLGLRVEELKTKGLISTVTASEISFGVDQKNSFRNNRHQFTFGSTFGIDKKWTIAFESSFATKGDIELDDNKSLVGEEKAKIAIGGYYIPKYNAFSGYLNRVVYRGGLRYENVGIVAKGESIKDKAITLGVGLPLGGTFSNVNIGFEYGQKGTTASDLVKENYMNFSIGLSFNDRWFVKRRYD
ncbi:porin family protein [Flavobacterium oreochromis]|uniref:Outer membrane protein n=2 Tax=Flavobacterium TaxID=237 RepID=A0A246GAH5_9FLAO|nr:hypothetical protein [Flavobacterium oreochromis]OWP74236.1 hypothetical protein BWG23_14535 [Flavobacterium oreochromis]OWP76989.1 hypothetical protein BWK62_08545 [Flavobacterium oreochromis]POR27253.1 hypothetical protein BWK58_04550 [Flavobacterium columnare]